MLMTQDPARLARAIHACLLGGALGDALGADIEFMSLAQIRHRHPRGFEELPWHDGVHGAITDDTQIGDLARNQSKGCGTIMRVAPLAFMERDQIKSMAMETSALTHGHRTGQEAAAAWALILADLACGAEIDAAAARQIGAFGPETNRAIRRALQAPRDGAAETVETLGGGWVAEEALSIALYACLCARDLVHGLTIAVMHSGDSDSTGAIAGNALGLIFPDETLDHPWAQQVECADVIGKISADLALALTGRAGVLSNDYPGV